MKPKYFTGKHLQPSRNVEWMLPVQIVARELNKYRARDGKVGNPHYKTFPTHGRSTTKKKNYKDMTKLIIKFKRRERWEMLKAELGSEYLERIHEASLINSNY